MAGAKHKKRSAMTYRERNVITFPKPDLPVIPDGERVAITDEQAIDYPVFDMIAGSLTIVRAPRLDMREVEWTKQLMTEHADWLSAIEMGPIDRYDLEYEMPFRPGSKRGGQWIGLPRLDALLYHGDTVSILESKLVPYPSGIAGGIGQLLYYKSAFEAHMGIKVDNLILATPYMPPALVTMIERFYLPIKILKVTEQHYIGCVGRQTKGACDVSA